MKRDKTIQAILREHPEAINLLEKNGHNEEHRANFESFKKRIKGFSIEHPDGTKAGDIVLFYNGYFVKMFTEVLGFDGDGNAYLLWDCYWFPMNLDERRIKVFSGILVGLFNQFVACSKNIAQRFDKVTFSTVKL